MQVMQGSRIKEETKGLTDLSKYTIEMNIKMYILNW